MSLVVSLYTIVAGALAIWLVGRTPAKDFGLKHFVAALLVAAVWPIPLLHGVVVFLRRRA